MQWENALLRGGSVVDREFKKLFGQKIQDDLEFPSGPKLDLLLRYRASIQREHAFTLNQLERLQRARKGEHVPAPVSVQLSND